MVTYEPCMKRGRTVGRHRSIIRPRGKLHLPGREPGSYSHALECWDTEFGVIA